MKKVKMLSNVMGTANQWGSEVRVYSAGEELPQSQEWQAKLAHTFVEMGVACYVDDQPVMETKIQPEEAPKRKGRPRKVV